MEDQIPITSGHEIDITQPTHEAPADAAEVDALVPVPVLVQVVDGLAAVRKTLMGKK